MIPNRHHQLRPFPWALTSATYLISPLRHLHKHLQRNTLKMEFDVLLIFNPAAAAAAAAAAKLFQSCPTLCDPRDGSPPGSPIPGILQARTLEWVAISFSNAWKSEREVAQSCPTVSNPMGCSLPGSSIHSIFQARVLEWGAIAFSTIARGTILTIL